MSSELQIRDQPDTGCYEGLVDDQVVGVIVYRRFGNRIVLRHTVIEPQFRGGGLGTQLVRAVLDDLRGQGLTLTNYCGFVADFIAANPDYQGLVDSGRPGATLSPGKRGKYGAAAAVYQ